MTEFEKLYLDYFDDVYRYICRLSGNEHIAEEITSETFFRAMKSIGGFRKECDVRVWLCQIAKNCYYTYVKKHPPSEALDEEALLRIPSSQEKLEEQLARQDTAQEIQEILHSIDEPYREVFMWRVYAELSFKQIGQIFGRTDNWACVTYHRAKKMIQARLEGNHFEKRM